MSKDDHISDVRRLICMAFDLSSTEVPKAMCIRGRSTLYSHYYGLDHLTDEQAMNKLEEDKNYVLYGEVAAC